ncbi:hypothetical protein BJ912DRAFT_1143401 [Pholiota molesta]|nr:hypothetical protein BJ912DRAFT_1143401 [Pholiota molesta]
MSFATAYSISSDDRMSEDGPAVKKAKPSGIKRRAVGSGPKGKDKARTSTAPEPSIPLPPIADIKEVSSMVLQCSIIRENIALEESKEQTARLKIELETTQVKLEIEQELTKRTLEVEQELTKRIQEEEFTKRTQEEELTKRIQGEQLTKRRVEEEASKRSQTDLLRAQAEIRAAEIAYESKKLEYEQGSGRTAIGHRGAFQVIQHADNHYGMSDPVIQYAVAGSPSGQEM